MHILPQLREIEKQYPDDVAVIGVHSGKYIAERETSRIREASLRYEITHPMYVADSENHTVSAVDLQTGKTRALAGTGKQMRTRSDRDQGALSSPWDLAVVEQTIYVAMAGIHQIWAIDSKTSRARVHSGTGGEDIADGPHPSALLARVARHHNGELLVADSYNDALKWVNAETREARTWLRGFHEPGGVAAAERCAYIADTNAHRIMIADYESGQLRVLEIAS